MTNEDIKDYWRSAYFNEKYKKEELEKENAELEENYRKRGEIICSLERQIRLHIHSDKFTKAKELVQNLLNIITTEVTLNPLYLKLTQEAEQFLKEVEE